MKENKPVIKIFNFSNPLMTTEWLTLHGNKYAGILPFEWVLTSNYSEAEVVAWDGIITPKNQDIVSKLIDDFKSSKILLFIGESTTIFKDHPVVQMVDTSGIRFVQLNGWSILPEEILSALEECYQKLKNV